ncbi:MAG: tetratricopeptide repeat protein [Phycisphaerae bacterium]
MICALAILQATIVPPVVAQSNQAAQNRPAPPPGVLRHCVNLIGQKRYEQARSVLEPLVEQHPDWPRARFILALAWHKQSRYEEARTHFEHAIRLDPNDAQVYVFYGWCLYYLGEPETARTMFEKFLGVQPEYDDALFAIALIDFDADKLDQATAGFEKVIALAVANRRTSMEAKSRARLADVQIRQKKFDDARKQLNASIRLNPDNYEAYYKLSRVLTRLGEHDAAEEALKKHREVKERIRPTSRKERRPDG